MKDVSNATDNIEFHKKEERKFWLLAQRGKVRGYKYEFFTELKFLLKLKY